MSKEQISKIVIVLKAHGEIATYNRPETTHRSLRHGWYQDSAVPSKVALCPPWLFRQLSDGPIGNEHGQLGAAAILPRFRSLGSHISFNIAHSGMSIEIKHDFALLKQLGPLPTY